MILAHAAAILSVISSHCGEMVMDRERLPNLSWCKGGTGIASAWMPREDRVFALMVCETSFPTLYAAYGGHDMHLYKEFETLEEWSDFAER